MIDTPSLGKFEANPSQSVSEWLYDKSLDKSNLYDELGDMGYDQFWCALILRDKDEKDWPEDKFQAYLVEEDSQGFFTYWGYEDAQAALTEWGDDKVRYYGTQADLLDSRKYLLGAKR